MARGVFSVRGCPEKGGPVRFWDAGGIGWALLTDKPRIGFVGCPIDLSPILLKDGQKIRLEALREYDGYAEAIQSGDAVHRGASGR